MKKALSLITLCALLSCSNAMRKLERETIIRRNANLQSFTGSYRETGLGKSIASTSIIYRREGAAVKAERSYNKKAVAVLSAAAGQLAVYYPTSTFAIRYRNLPSASAAQELQFLENEYDWHVAHYDIVQTESLQVAGRKTLGIRYTPKAEFAADPFLYTWRAQVDEEFAFPLANTMQKNDTELYSVIFDSVNFNSVAGDAKISAKLPAGATVAEYDYAGKNFSFAEASAQANFALVKPLPLAQQNFDRIIRVAGIIPAFTFVSAQMPYITLYSQVKDYGLKLIPEEGLSIAGKHRYRVSFFGAFKTIWFMRGTIYHTIVSNRPLSELLTWLDSQP